MGVNGGEHFARFSIALNHEGPLVHHLACVGTYDVQADELTRIPVDDGLRKSGYFSERVRAPQPPEIELATRNIETVCTRLFLRPPHPCDLWMREDRHRDRPIVHE